MYNKSAFKTLKHSSKNMDTYDGFIINSGHIVYAPKLQKLAKNFINALKKRKAV